AAKGRGLAAKRQALFSSEEYVNIYYSYSEGIPAVNFDGMKMSLHNIYCVMVN
ncbi:membrane protein, partial [Salmonella enterica subsp. enterica serovar Weltevreden]